MTGRLALSVWYLSCPCRRVERRATAFEGSGIGAEGNRGFAVVGGGAENATDSLFLFGRICGGEGRDGMGVAMAMATQPLRLRRLRVSSVAILPRLLPFIALWLLPGDC